MRYLELIPAHMLSAGRPALWPSHPQAHVMALPTRTRTTSSENVLIPMRLATRDIRPPRSCASRRTASGFPAPSFDPATPARIRRWTTPHTIVAPPCGVSPPATAMPTMLRASDQAGLRFGCQVSSTSVPRACRCLLYQAFPCRERFWLLADRSIVGRRHGPPCIHGRGRKVAGSSGDVINGSAKCAADASSPTSVNPGPGAHPGLSLMK